MSRALLTLDSGYASQQPKCRESRLISMLKRTLRSENRFGLIAKADLSDPAAPPHSRHWRPLCPGHQNDYWGAGRGIRCPFCGRLCGNARLWSAHLGAHLSGGVCPHFNPNEQVRHREA
ncbi:hypothetical protein ONE63_009322 [Megalurothrips usitatus]|uniref:C2H2-type domain-containing protein n=1 Tax=Megalurothrips usitatus TaxID=439358 RepID=A0AAV7XNZ3_9NEOP|nr:hypothetical protein ONE63_009322 [Megalurothrips usitatus]